MELLGLTLPLLVVSVVLWFARHRTAKAEIDRLIARAGLPDELRLTEPARRRLVWRQELLCIGLGLGVVVAGTVLAASGDGEPGVGPVTWMLAAAVFVGGASTCLAHYRSGRESRAEAPRTAALRPRALTDYLSPFEIIAQFGLPLVPAIAVALGVLVLDGTDRPGRGWSLVVGGVIAMALSALAFSLQRFILGIHHPAGDQAELRWQEALRAAALRDLAMVVYTVCWMLGAAAASDFVFPAGLPGFVEPLVNVVFGLATVVVIACGWIAVTGYGLRRVERVTG